MDATTFGDFYALNAWVNLGSYLKVYGGLFFGGIKRAPSYNSSPINSLSHMAFGVGLYTVDATGPEYLATGYVNSDELDGPVIVELHDRKNGSPLTFQAAWMQDKQISTPRDGDDGLLPTRVGARLYSDKLTEKFDFTATWIWAQESSNKYSNTYGVWFTFNGLVDGLNFTTGYTAIAPYYTHSTGGSVTTDYSNAIDLFGSVKLSETFSRYTQNVIQIGWKYDETGADNDLVTDFVLSNVFATAIPLDAAQKVTLTPTVKNILITKTTSTLNYNVSYADTVRTTDILTLATELRYGLYPGSYAWIGLTLEETFAQYKPRKTGEPKKNDDVIVYDNKMAFSIPVGIKLTF
jgi:hypothetical protein